VRPGYEPQDVRTPGGEKKLGNKTLVLVNDSKTRESLYYHLPVDNHPRGRVWEIGETG